ncbi:hypothetical protein MMC19_003922 [Ptychographa xylographoides]|nr:hypothetical protein [Ptychographa xylographoides]
MVCRQCWEVTDTAQRPDESALLVASHVPACHVCDETFFAQYPNGYIGCVCLSPLEDERRLCWHCRIGALDMMRERKQRNEFLLRYTFRRLDGQTVEYDLNRRPEREMRCVCGRLNRVRGREERRVKMCLICKGINLMPRVGSNIHRVRQYPVSGSEEDEDDDDDDDDDDGDNGDNGGQGDDNNNPPGNDAPPPPASEQRPQPSRTQGNIDNGRALERDIERIVRAVRQRRHQNRTNPGESLIARPTSPFPPPSGRFRPRPVQTVPDNPVTLNITRTGSRPGNNANTAPLVSTTDSDATEPNTPERIDNYLTHLQSGGTNRHTNGTNGTNGAGNGNGNGHGNEDQDQSPQWLGFLRVWEQPRPRPRTEVPVQDAHGVWRIAVEGETLRDLEEGEVLEMGDGERGARGNGREGSGGPGGQGNGREGSGGPGASGIGGQRPSLQFQ